MNIVLSLLVIAFLTFILNVLIRQSYNFIFMFFKKPIMWAVFMGLLSFICFFIGSQFNNLFDIIWWSVLLAFVVNIPPKLNKKLEKETSIVVNEVYKELGIEKGRLKYRIGLAAYLLGGILGWFIFYGELIRS
ncbi:MAG: hypothetical protein WCV69_02165 [Patescibacteria group bacterium]